MEVDIICNDCLKTIRTENKESFNYHHKDYCERCKLNDN